MLRAESLYRVSGVLFLVSLLTLGCGGAGSKPSDASKADSFSLADTQSVDSASPLLDTMPPFAAEAPEAGLSSIDLGTEGSEAGSVAPAIDARSEAGKPPQPPSTIIVLPDTQYYAASYPNVFTGQTDWIVAQKTALNIAAALHVGDIVDFDITAQWTVANPAMRRLDSVVPYVVVPGNHDYSNANRKSMIDNYFDPSSMPWITGTMTPGQIENSYTLVDIGPQKWLILGLEFGPRDSVVAWANTVLKDPRYSQYPVILLTHGYLYSDGTRYNINVAGTDSTKSSYQNWSPQYYGFTAADGINDGEAMWQKLVLPNSNVRLVFCGHQTGWARLTSTRPDGTSVHQMLSDYQWLEGENFGFGYLRVVQFDYASKKIQVQTFSPYLNAFLTDDPNQFTLDLNL